ncbi:hypothetical protein HPB50_009328 [Hyalomma asiaticum]|uniref:Uncharacterized protein n=1 Tax=Hyalomma asiaticum TaxID=266040 RepID=A0ACB7RZF9_HYAAI|nr:hypothetical protein HPB50_009328 [Hyalomma asiaticum]
MATLTKTSLREALHQKGVSVPPGSPKETLVRLYREHFPASDSARDSLLDFSSDEEAETKASTLLVSSGCPAGLDDGRPLAPRSNGAQLVALVSVVGILDARVASVGNTTRSVYEKRLQRYLDSSGTPKPVASHEGNNNTAEFSATEEEPENDEDDYEGTPLQDVPPPRLGLGASGSGSYLGYGSTYGGVFGTSDAFESPLTSRTSTSFTGASPPLQMSLRNRPGAAARQEESRSANHVGAKAGQQQRKGMSLLLKVALAVAFVGINVLIYANLEYFKSDTPVPSVVTK